MTRPAAQDAPWIVHTHKDGGNWTVTIRSDPGPDARQRYHGLALATVNLHVQVRHYEHLAGLLAAAPGMRDALLMAMAVLDHVTLDALPSSQAMEIIGTIAAISRALAAIENPEAVETSS